MAEFKNKAAALRWLADQGWAIGKSAFYEHCRDGKLRACKDGGFTERAVRRYAKKFLARAETGETSQDAAARGAAEEKAAAEARMKLAVAKKRELEVEIMQARYVPRSKLETELAARAAVLTADMRHLAVRLAPEITSLAGGDPGRVPAVRQVLLAEIDRALDRYADDREFLVIFEQAQEGA